MIGGRVKCFHCSYFGRDVYCEHDNYNYSGEAA